MNPRQYQLQIQQDIKTKQYRWFLKKRNEIHAQSKLHPTKAKATNAAKAIFPDVSVKSEE